MGYTQYIRWGSLRAQNVRPKFQSSLNVMGVFLNSILKVKYKDAKLIGPVLRKAHYFKTPEEKAFLQADRPIVWYDDHGDVRGIAFNGIQGKDDFEDFMLFREELDALKTNYCKTGRMDYDNVVVGCLTILNHHLPEIVASDGESADWQLGVEAVNKILGADYKNPLIQEEDTMVVQTTSKYGDYQLALLSASTDFNDIQALDQKRKMEHSEEFFTSSKKRKLSPFVVSKDSETENVEKLEQYLKQNSEIWSLIEQNPEILSNVQSRLTVPLRKDFSSTIIE